MYTLNSQFKQNLESAIREHGRFACPDIDCTNWITSKEINKADGSKFLEYHCTNPSCDYHQKEIIFISNNEDTNSKLQENLASRSKKSIVLASSIFLIISVALGNILPLKIGNNSASILPKKEKIAQPIIEKKILLSTPVFPKVEKETSSIKARKIMLSTPVFKK